MDDQDTIPQVHEDAYDSMMREMEEEGETELPALVERRLALIDGTFLEASIQFEDLLHRADLLQRSLALQLRFESSLSSLKQTETRLNNWLSGATSSSSSPQSSASLIPSNNLEDAPEDTATVRRLRRVCKETGLLSSIFKQVPSDYYQRPLDARRALLGAETTDHLCKSIIVENTVWEPSFPNCGPLEDPNNARYYCLMLQYTTKLNSDKVLKFVREVLGKKKLSKSKFSFRLAPQEVGESMAGFVRNAITPIGMKSPIPVIVSKPIVELKSGRWWMGGGEVDVKLEVSTEEFIRVVNPFIADIVYDGLQLEDVFD